MRAAMAQWPISRKGNRMAQTIGKALAKARADADRRKLETTTRDTPLGPPIVEDILGNVERINAATLPKKRKNGLWMFFREPKL
jgi:hypothetical protein